MKKCNTRKTNRRRQVWNLIKGKFDGRLTEREKELSIDEHANFTVFTQQDEDERYERHMKPIRKAQDMYDN